MRPLPGVRETLARLALVAASLMVVALAAEGALRFSGYVPARSQGPGELYGARERLFLDCYPSNPRGYFDVDLRQPAVRAAYAARGVAGVDAVAARAPYAVEFRYNALFFRDRELTPKPPGVVRVVLLGDSFTEGQGVKEKDTTARQLEALLNASGDRRWEVLNCARRGADFPSLHKMFEKVLPFEPDVVVYAMVLNDPERSPDLEARHGPMDDWILDHRRLLGGQDSGRSRRLSFRLADFVGDRVQAWRVGRETTQWYLDLYGPANREGWARTQAEVRDMDRQMRERGGRFVLASWPLLVDLDAYPFAAADEAVARLCADAGIPRVDLRVPLQGHPAESLWVHPVDHHPNEVAHRLAAEALVKPVLALR
ncbi:MAG TPA: SGNH/GDSL hydrolase family protein [Vicinamibacteria bacterium]|nr:SGNH/GDSL hydrolase family protein [Vicinamibacteria bacterium]